jgi:hypothetical protein
LYRTRVATGRLCEQRAICTEAHREKNTNPTYAFIHGL